MSDHAGSDELLIEHETEQHEGVDTAPVPPLKTVVVDSVVVAPIIPQHVQCYTLVLTADDPIQVLLEQDALRTNAIAIALDHDVVLSHSFQQASDEANQINTLLRPNGSVITNAGGFPPYLPLDTTAKMWVVGNTFPSRVSVVVKRRTA